MLVVCCVRYCWLLAVSYWLVLLRSIGTQWGRMRYCFDTTDATSRDDILLSKFMCK